MQTHTSYADEEGFYVWAHTFDYHMKVKSVAGWPKFLFKVWRLNDINKYDVISYGVMHLPNETGSFTLECPTWRPIVGWREEALNFYLGGPPRLTDSD